MPKIRFPQINRVGPIGLADGEHARLYRSQSLARASLKPFTDDQARKWRNQVAHSTNLGEPVKNGENHALSVMCVLDLLLRLHHNEYIYAAGIYEHLERDYGHLVIWDNITIGRILTGIATLCADKDQPAMEFGTHRGARVYVVREDYLDGWRYLGALREKAAQVQLNLLKLARHGEVLPRPETFWNEMEQAA